MYNRLNQEKELQWRLQVVFKTKGFGGLGLWVLTFSGGLGFWV